MKKRLCFMLCLVMLVMIVGLFAGCSGKMPFSGHNADFEKDRISVETVEPLTFIADRPFVFVIADDETGTILFMGKLYDVK